MYYGPTTNSNLEGMSPEKYVTIDSMTISSTNYKFWGVNTIDCNGQAALGASWTIFGTLAYEEGHYGTDRSLHGTGDTLFIMTASDFKIQYFSWTQWWNDGGSWSSTNAYQDVYHCGWIICKSAIPADEYWGYRNRWLAGNAYTSVIAYSNYASSD